MAKFCIHCGSKLGDGDKFCMHCGTKCADTVAGTAQPSKSEDATPSAAQNALDKAEKILLSPQAIPDYSQALVHLVQAKKLGAKTKQMETLMLLDQLYRTIDMLRQSYTEIGVSTDGTNAGTAAKRAASQPAPHTLLGHRQTNSGSQQPTNSDNTTSNMGTYMKAAAIGAVTGAVANTLLGRHDVQARDDMLDLMRSDNVMAEEPDTLSDADEYEENNDTTYNDDVSDNTSYDEDDTADDNVDDISYTDDDANEDWSNDDEYDTSDVDSSFDFDDGGDDFF